MQTGRKSQPLCLLLYRGLTPGILAHYIINVFKILTLSDFHNTTRDRKVNFAFSNLFCACAQKQRIPVVIKQKLQKNNYYKFDCKIEILAGPSVGVYTFCLLKRLLQKTVYYKKNNYCKFYYKI